MHKLFEWFLDGVRKNKHYEYCSSNGHAKVNMLSEKERWLKFYYGQHQFKILFMLYTDFESIFKRVAEPYTGKINARVPSIWCVHSRFVDGDVLDPLKMYHGKDCVEKVEEHIKNEVKWLYATFRQQLITALSDVLKTESGRHEVVEKCHIFLKEFNNSENKKVKDNCRYTDLYRGAANKNFNIKY